MAASDTPKGAEWWQMLPSLPDVTDHKQHSVYELEDVVFFKDADGKVHAKKMQDVFKHLADKAEF